MPSENDLYTFTPVGSYSGGASPYGLLDMLGNVWEWTKRFEGLPLYNPEDGWENLEAEGERVLRGGASFDDRRAVRCAFRIGFNPDLRVGDGGFRAVVSPG